jgi:tetratricopeptide (TPR) repeat protein
MENIIGRYTYVMNYGRIGLAMARVMNNDKDIDLELLRNYAYEIKTRSYESNAFRYMAQILLNIDNEHMPEAESWIKKAIEADRRSGMKFFLGEDYALYTELLKRKGCQTKAKENLNKAIEIYRECGADGWVEKAEQQLTSL